VFTLCGGAGSALRQQRSTERLRGIYRQNAASARASRIRVNERIRDSRNKGDDDQGGQLGVLQPFESHKAQGKRSDLVENLFPRLIAVCKITDYANTFIRTTKRPRAA